MMEPVKKTRLYEDIIQQIVQKIETGELQAGEKLPTERELVAQMGVSRTSIREALRAMELIGLVESKVGEGTYIKSLSVDKAFLNLAQVVPTDEQFLLDMYEVRILLESYSAKQAARRRTEEHLAQLRHSIELLNKDIGSVEARTKADTLFHQTIAKAAGNTALISVLSLCSELINSSITIANAYVNTLDIVYEHQAMYDAIERQSDKIAERLMRAHIKRAHDRTKFVLSNAAKEAQDS